MTYELQMSACTPQSASWRASFASCEATLLQMSACTPQSASLLAVLQW